MLEIKHVEDEKIYESTILYGSSEKFDRKNVEIYNVKYDLKFIHPDKVAYDEEGVGEYQFSLVKNNEGKWKIFSYGN